MRADGTEEAITLPPSALPALADLLDPLASGDGVTVLADDAEVTPEDAAGILGISRPLVTRRMDIGLLPFRRVGTHRRIRLADVLTLRAREVPACKALYQHPPALEESAPAAVGITPQDVVDGCSITNRSIDVLAICKKEIAEVRRNLAYDSMRHSQAWHNRIRLVMPPLGSDRLNQIENGLDQNNEKSTLADIARLRRLEAAEAYQRTHAKQQLHEGYLLPPLFHPDSLRNSV